MKYKLLFWIVFVIAILEGVWICYSSKLENNIGLSPYSFYDSYDKNDNTSGNVYDSLVTAEGSWISTSGVAFPLSTLKIECWKDFGHCWIADGTIMNFKDSTIPFLTNNFLSIGLELKEIAFWNDDFIETKPSKPLMGCVEETYRIDRRSKVVTYTRRTVDNTSEICKGIQEEPIVAKLGSGQERIDAYKKSN